MGRLKNKIRNIKDTYITPKDEPRREHEQPGTLHIVTPGGRIEISAVLGGKSDARDIKRVLDIVLNSDDEYDAFIGRTD